MFDEEDLANIGLSDDDDLQELLKLLDVKPIYSRPWTCPSQE